MLLSDENFPIATIKQPPKSSYSDFRLWIWLPFIKYEPIALGLSLKKNAQKSTPLMNQKTYQQPILFLQDYTPFQKKPEIV